MRKGIFMLCVLLAACSGQQTKQDLPSDLDTDYLSAEIANYISLVLPPASTTVWIRPEPKVSDVSSSFEATVNKNLRELGFAVAENDAGSNSSHLVSYETLSVDNGLLLKIVVDDVFAARLYERYSADQLSPKSQFTVRNLK